MSEKIKIIFLGTSDAIPTAERNHTSILLKYKKENILVDCGEGTQRQFRKAKLNPGKLTRILITHWHGDHILGIPGILQTLALSGYRKTLFIYGPEGTKKYMREILKTFVFVNKIKLEIREVKTGKFIDEQDFYFEVQRMSHGTPCNAYKFVKKGEIKIDKQKLKKIEIPAGPLLKRLKQGRNISYKGKKYLAKNLTFEEHSKKISFVLDTSMNDKIIPFVKDSNLLICESSFSSELTTRAKKYKHLTVEQASKIAKKSKSKKLVLIHVSQRYRKEPQKILKQAKKIFKNSFLVKDLDIIEV